MLKVAVIVLAAFMVTTHTPLPGQPLSLQPGKLEPGWLNPSENAGA
jgi:hypothetical protein